MTKMSEKSERQNRIRGYLIQDMPHKDIMLKEGISQSTLWRDITQIGKADNKPLKRPAYVFATRSFMFRAKRKRILDTIHDLGKLIPGTSEDVGARIMVEGEIRRQEKILEMIDKNFDDWMFKSGVIKESVTEQKVKISFPTSKVFEEKKSGEDKTKLPAAQIPTKISLEFKKDTPAS